MEGITILVKGKAVARVIRSSQEQYTISSSDDRVRGILTKAVSPGSKFREKFSENLLFLPACLQDILPGIRAQRIRSGI